MCSVAGAEDTEDKQMSAGLVCADWKQLARAASTEMNPQRLMQLIEELTQALDETRTSDALASPVQPIQ